MSYSEKYKDPRWQKRRLEVFERDHWACRLCKATGSTLHAHHLYYVSNRDPWNYPPASIISLCDPCHEKIHTITEKHWLLWEASFDPLIK